MSTLAQIIEKNGDYLADPVIPLHPFLRTKAQYVDDRVLKERLNAMGGIMNLVPNTVAWNEHFQTTGPMLTDTLTKDGRRLVLDDEPARGPIGEDLHD